MALFKKRSSQTTIAELQLRDEGWKLASGAPSGQPLIVRLRGDLDDASDRADWPIRIGIAIPLNSPSPDGLPTAEEDQALGYIESTICAIAGDRVVLAIVITTSGMREFVLHSRTSDWIPAFHQELQAAIATHQVQMVAEHDESWAVYESFWT